MSYELIFNNFRRFIPLDEDDEKVIFPFLTPRVFKRGAFINAEGEINRYTNFITSGSARVFHLDPSGQEHVVQLGIRGWWISDYASFLSQQPGRLYTEALEPTEVISISYDNLELMFATLPKMERFYRLLIQRAYMAFQARMLNNLSMDAEARYLAFRDANPEIDTLISQKHIASYLGMSAEFLSKIKKRVLKSKKIRKHDG
ncbi:MAG: Crp/Fnr family transcriptional regulator [Saprospiraceae bacterium]|nr:Crp/Fnr family transcriptional regulator [Saprospiraceae bacterium]